MNEKQKNSIILVIAFLFITCGGLLYIAYRPKTLLLFSLAETLHLSNFVDYTRDMASGVKLPDFILFSLPAGLWTASYLLIMYYLTRRCIRKTRLQLSLPLPLSAVVLEGAQYFSICPGTFDIIDLLCYFIPIVIFIIYA